VSAQFPSDPIEAARREAAEADRADRGEQQSAFRAWGRLSAAIARAVPEGFNRAEASRRRIARRR